MNFRKSNPGHGRHSEDVATFDLLRGGNRYFRATFDFFTPRAHFVLLTHSKGPTDYQDLNPNQKVALVEAVESLRQRFGLNKAVFSIHRGGWVSNHAVFHTHLCVNTDQYIEVFSAQESYIPDWPNAKHVTGKWMKKGPGDYKENVRRYSPKSYHTSEVGQIKAMRRNARGQPQGLSSSETWGRPSMRLVFHPSQPRIGFAFADSTAWGTCRPEGRVQLLDTLDSFAAKHGLKGKSQGCHVCVVLDEASRRSMLPGEIPIAGYIQISAEKFYSLCPGDLKDAWFRNFEGADVKVYT